MGCFIIHYCEKEIKVILFIVLANSYFQFVIMHASLCDTPGLFRYREAPNPHTTSEGLP